MTGDIITTDDIKSLPTWRAINLLLTGKASTQKEACEMVNISPDTFLAHLRKYPQLSVMFIEFKNKLETEVAMQLEAYADARASFVKTLIEKLADENTLLQDRVMAFNKLESIFGSFKSATPELDKGTQSNDSEAAMMLAKRLNGATLRPAISKITVEFEKPEATTEGEYIEVDDSPPDQIR